MRRRDFIVLLGSAAFEWPLAVRAQQSQRLARIGFLRVGPPPKTFIGGIQKGLQEQGLVEGKNTP
jgi:putative ABC transport system substrate-binding protein